VTPAHRRSLALELVAAGARLAEAGLILPREGNLSARVDDGSFLLTPKGADKGRLRAVDLVEVRLDEDRLPSRASSDAATHRSLYLARPEVGAVVHAHPRWVLTLARRGETPDISLLEEGRAFLGEVSVVGLAGGPAVPSGNRVAAAMGGTAAGVLHRHGAITVAGTVGEALFRMLLLERLAELTWRGP
jgi:L-fuculose-phosphate aldolase